MRTKSNVNPGHYKTDGRERPGDAGVPELQKAKLARARSRPASPGSRPATRTGAGRRDAPGRKG